MRKVLLSIALRTAGLKASKGIVAAVVALIAAIIYTTPSEEQIYDFTEELLNEKLDTSQE